MEISACLLELETGLGFRVFKLQRGVGWLNDILSSTNDYKEKFNQYITLNKQIVGKMSD